MAVPIAGLKRRRLELPDDCDLTLGPHKLETLSVYAHVVDHQMITVLVRNDTARPINLLAKAKLRVITDYEAAGCFAIGFSHHGLASRAPKHSLNWFKTGIQKLMAAAAVFSAAIARIVTEKIHSTGVTIHSIAESQNSISAIIADFPTLWQDTESIKNDPESE